MSKIYVFMNIPKIFTFIDTQKFFVKFIFSKISSISKSNLISVHLWKLLPIYYAIWIGCRVYMPHV
jgi:hypothetical protein